MEVSFQPRGGRGRGFLHESPRGRPLSRNKQWIAGESGGSTTPLRDTSERWERGGHRGGRGTRGPGRRRFPNQSTRGGIHSVNQRPATEEVLISQMAAEPVLDTMEEREAFYKELVKARELERKSAIAEGKMDDPTVAKSLSDAITIVGTCMDMCPRFERYRRERENNLMYWELIPGTKRVDHSRAVKIYERAAGDKSLPSDIRPPEVLKRTLDYLFHDLLAREGLDPSQPSTFPFIRDRARAVRNDFTLQLDSGPISMECHERCARFHILLLHIGKMDNAQEVQQLMNTLQSLKEFYADQRGNYEFTNELEMRIYHRLTNMRDQRERNDMVPPHIEEHPVYKLTTDFRLHVQRNSAPISKTSKLIVDSEGMQIFGALANVLRAEGNIVMIFLIACILEHIFGKDTIDDIDAIRGDLTNSQIIDGISVSETHDDTFSGYEDYGMEGMEDEGPEITEIPTPPAPAPTALAPEWPSSNFSSPFGSAAPTPPPIFPSTSAFAGLAASSSPFSQKSVFGQPATGGSVFGLSSASPSPAPSGFGTSNVFDNPEPPPATSSPFISAPSTIPTPPPTFDAPARTSSPWAGSTSNNIFGNGASTSLNILAPKAIVPISTTSEASTSIPTFFAPKPVAAPVPQTASPAPNIFATVAEPASAPQTNGFASFFNSGTSSIFGTNPSTSSAPPSSQPIKPGFFNAAFTAADASKPPSGSLNPLAPTFTPTSSANSTASTESPSEKASSSKRTSVPSPLNLVSPTTYKSIGFPGSGSSPRTPPLPKIDTNISITPPVVSTPKMTPPTPRMQPISLPSTPTLTETSKSIIGLRNNGGMLSPLVLNSPGLFRAPSMQNFESPAGPSGSSKSFFPNGAFEAPPSPSSGKKGKGKAVAEPEPALPPRPVSPSIEEEDTVKDGVDEAAYQRACMQSDTYSDKIQARRSQIGTPSDRKRTLSSTEKASASSSRTYQPKKRIKHRVSSEYRPPRTDEDLATRLKENHEDHQKRWAPGSFLRILRLHAKTKASVIPASWNAWLSTNPDVDGTAIWLERKFHVPDSGQWRSESVFSIPLIESATSLSFPGIIIFECSPLDGISDDLDRKYRTLDDCARLRDIVKSMPAKRHFVPALLTFYWAGDGDETPGADYIQMVQKLVDESVLSNYRIFAVTAATKDLDNKFAEALDSLQLDFEGKLVRTLNLRGVFKLFEQPFNTFISQWLEKCNITGQTEWALYGRLVQVTIDLLNAIAESVGHLVSNEGAELPAFDPAGLQDSDSMYDAAMQWLSNSDLGSAGDSVSIDLHSQREMDRQFPTRNFLDRLHQLVRYQTEILVGGDPKAELHVPVTDINSAIDRGRSAIRSLQTKLELSWSLSVRRSPKRRGTSEVTEETSSEHHKRRRLSPSVTSNPQDSGLDVMPYINGRATPSPSASTVSLAPSTATVSMAPADPPIVTIAMLRALTKNIKQKYGKS